MIVMRIKKLFTSARVLSLPSEIHRFLIDNDIDWLARAEIENAIIEITEDKKIHWLMGTWFNGHWHGDTWRDGTWYDGYWHQGEWLNGKWHSGKQLAGEFETESQYSNQQTV